MSELDEIKQGVEGVRNAVAEAKIASEQAQTIASDKMNEFAGLGLEGVAQVLNTCADTMGTAVAQLGTAFSLCDETVNGLSGITDQTQISQTTQALDGAKQKLTTAGQEVEGAAAQANEALQHAQHSEVEPVMNAVFHALGQIDQAKAANESAKSKAEQYRTQIQERAGNGLLAAASSGSGGQTAPPRPAVPMHSGWKVTPLDAAPPKEREPRAKVGDPIEPPKGGPDDTSDHRAELKSTDDDDTTKGKFQRGLRAAVRGVGSLKNQSVETTKPMYKIMDAGWDPPSEDQYESSTQADARPTWEAPSHAKLEAHDHASNLVVLTVLTAEWLSRGLKRR